MRQGPLAGRYPAVAAMVTLALIPYLALSAALDPAGADHLRATPHVHPGDEPTMHPAIGYALIEHSNFFDDPVDRGFRSLPGILGTVYDGPEAAATGKQVRDFHKDIKGIQPDGTRYHALNPDTYWWAHATFQRMVYRVAEHWDRYELSDADRDQLYNEGCVWYRRYGVGDSVVPDNRNCFNAKWIRFSEQVLEPNPASDYLIEYINRSAIPDLSGSSVSPLPPRLATRIGLGPKQF